MSPTSSVSSFERISELLQSAGASLLDIEPPAANGLSSANSIDDPASAVADALADPIEFPPFAQATVPGDRVAIALDENVPSPVEIVTGLVQGMRHAGVDLNTASIVVSNDRLSQYLQTRLDPQLTERLTLVCHDPDGAQSVCYVGTTHSDRTLRINRVLYDADVILPVGCARLPETPGYAGVYESLFPRFADNDAIQTWRSPQGRAVARQTERVNETDEAGWLLGAPLVVEVVPGPHGSVQSVVAGAPQAVAREIEQIGRRLWCRQVGGHASLVVATLSGDEDQQNWENVARVIAAANHVVSEEGAIAICCEVDYAPGTSLRRLGKATDLESLLRKLEREGHADSASAWQFADALTRGPVYLMSRLDADTVEELGLAPIANLDELVRLASRHKSVVVLEDAHHTLARVANGS